jgi:hypothetical protein
MKRAASSVRPRIRKIAGTHRPGKLREVLVIAEQQGLLQGEKTEVVRGRMPRALVARAKKRTGIASDTELIELALANIAVGDDYADWLLSRRGSVDRGADLEF